MRFEAYIGSRPHRPRLLVALMAAALAGALGLAWLQVHGSRALGPETRVGDTPIRVRLPQDWQQHQRHPQRFILPVPSGDRRRQMVDFERQIHFSVDRLRTFLPMPKILRLLELDDRQMIDTLRAAPIGQYDAVEIHKLVPLAIGRQTVRRETIVRFTCLPRGELIRVVYDPLIDLRPADKDILDDVCRSLRLDDPSLNGEASQYLQEAGIEFTPPGDWLVVGANFPEVPGVYIGGSSVDRVPAWSLGIHRIWLGPGRSAADVLRDFASTAWDTRNVTVDERKRPDAATIARIDHPSASTNETAVVSAWIVAESPREVLIVHVFAGADQASAANEAAEQIVTEARLQPIEQIAEPNRLLDIGARLISRVQRSGPEHWGRDAFQAVYRREGFSEVVRVRRVPIQGDPERGYEGTTQRQIGQTIAEDTQWRTDAQTRTYRWQLDLVSGRELHIVEQRPRDDGPVTRVLTPTDTPPVEFRFAPGSAFAPPPIEDVVLARVARGDADAAMFEMSTALGDGTHTVLARRLPPQGELLRVLIQEDYWPIGAIRAVREQSLTTEYEAHPESTYRRVDRAQPQLNAE